MVFSSLTFLFLFLPAALLIYRAAPRRAGNAVLFLTSLLFYAWGEPVYVVLMLFSTLLDYGCGRLTERLRDTQAKRLGLVLSLCGNLGLLGFFKYAGFLARTVNSLAGTAFPVPDLPLPIGISFYTFQTMSYTIDVYRGKVRAQKNILAFGAYVALFPQLIAGPIVRYEDIAGQLDGHCRSKEKCAAGVRRFLCGLGKKVLLANNIGPLWEAIVQIDPARRTALAAGLGLLAYSFHLYFDFSGYSDMAIGLGKMFGFDFPENFRHPYTAGSITDFWRRWHISLGRWFQDYVYIPLGGSRRGLAVQIRNIAIVWLLTGLWHGASWNFVLWGGYFGVLLILEKCFLLEWLQKAPALIGHIYTLAAVLLSWILFAFEDLGQGFAYLRALLGGGGLVGSDALYLLLSYWPLLLLCAAGSTPLPKRLYETLTAGRSEGLLLTADLAGLLCGLALCVSYLVSGSYNPFLYFRF